MTLEFLVFSTFSDLTSHPFSSELLRSIVKLFVMATEELFDVIVIGAGVEGSATAYQLTKLAKEKRVALVEQVGS